MVEGAALEKQYARKGIVGSNPTLSARNYKTTLTPLFAIIISTMRVEQ